MNKSRIYAHNTTLWHFGCWAVFILTWINDQLIGLFLPELDHWPHSPYLPLNTYYTDQTLIALISALTTANATALGTVWPCQHLTGYKRRHGSWYVVIVTWPLLSQFCLHTSNFGTENLCYNLGLWRSGHLPGREGLIKHKLHYGKWRIQAFWAMTDTRG